MSITVEWILINIGIMPHRNGYDYIRDIVKLTYHSNNTTLKPFYEAVAEEHNVSVFSIQNCIRKAIEAAFKNNKLQNINHILGVKACEDAPLTNSELVFLISNFMKNNAYRDRESCGL